MHHIEVFSIQYISVILGTEVFVPYFLNNVYRDGILIKKKKKRKH